MDISLNFKGTNSQKSNILFLGMFKKDKKADISHWLPEFQEAFQEIKIYKDFSAEAGKTAIFPYKDTLIYGVGLGEKEKIKTEKIRNCIASLYNQVKKEAYTKIEFDLNTFDAFDEAQTVVTLATEGILLANYAFDKYLSKKEDQKNKKEKKIILTGNPAFKKIMTEAFERASLVCKNINFARDLINEVPNILNSEELAKRVVADAKKELKNVKIKVLKKKDIVKEKMNLFLAVNKGSGYEPRLVHLSYTPSKMSKNTKHIALVGKGLVYDSGGYSIKSSMVGMKHDMEGAATVYAAFKNAVKLHADCKISCYLGITDNMISSYATVPDSIYTSRSGKSVEILNTDAEGRLVLADVMDYACDHKPDVMIDVATLTGACVRALGHVCGVMGNNSDLIQELLEKAKGTDERAWELPMFDEYREDIKSPVADIKNLNSSPEAGAQKAACFLEHFVRSKDIAWVHLDIAGVDMAPNLAYCPKGSGSGIMIRTLTDYLTNGKHKHSL